MLRFLPRTFLFMVTLATLPPIWRALNYINNFFSSSLVVVLVIGAAPALGLVVAIHRSE